MKNEPQQIAPYSVRMEPTIRQALEESARQNSRSLHAEIIVRLTQSLKMDITSESPLTESRVREIVREEFDEIKDGDVKSYFK